MNWKSPQLTNISPDLFALLLVSFATTIGLLLHVVFPLVASFRPHEGGLFYTVIHDLQANGYALPSFTTYDHALLLPRLITSVLVVVLAAHQTYHAWRQKLAGVQQGL